MINKVNKNLIITIFLIALFIFSTVLMSITIGGKVELGHNDPYSTNLANSIDDTNGKVDNKIDSSSGGDVPTDAVAIADEAGLKAFFNGNAQYGYLTADIANFNWGMNNNLVGTDYEFKLGRVLDGNGYSIKIKMPEKGNVANRHLKYKRLGNWDWVTFDQSAGARRDFIDASSAFIAVNQGTIKNVNFNADFMGGTYEFNHYTDGGSQPIAFGLVTGVNFGYINNCYLFQQGTIMMASPVAPRQWAKADENSVDFGGFAGLNVGQIMFSTVDVDGAMQANTYSKGNSALPLTPGDSGSRASLGGFAGRMLSDKNAIPNKVNISSATIYNCIIKGRGALRVYGNQTGGGVSYRHVGAVVGGNSYYSGSAVAKNTGRPGQNIGQIDGIISSFNGAIENSASGSPVGARAVIDCGRISNVTFLDNYKGHIDNCNCDPTGSGEHGATRANNIIVRNNGDVKISFDKTILNNAAIIATVTARNNENDLIFAVNKRVQTVDLLGNVVLDKTATPLFNYDSASYYSSESGVNNHKKAMVSIVEPRAFDDVTSFVLEVDFGFKAIASFEQPSASDLKYDGADKIKVNVKYGSDAAGQDTLNEQGKYITFKADRKYNNVTTAGYGLKLPGSYNNIQIVSSLSDKQAYVDPEQLVVAKVVMPGADYTINIDPADIVLTDAGNVEITGTEIKGANGLPLSEYKFRFKVYQDRSATNKVELKGQQFDRIQFTNQGTYNWQDVDFIVDNDFNVTASLFVNSSTSANGRNYRFRALMNNEPVTRTTVNYKLFIDNDAPEITVEAESGYSFGKWSDAPYDIIIKSPYEDLARLTINGSESDIQVITSGQEYRYRLNHNIEYFIKAYDSSGNVAEHIIIPKIDASIPLLDVTVMAISDDGDEYELPSGGAISKNIRFEVSMNSITMPYTYEYCISYDNDATGAVWKSVGDDNIVVGDRTFNPAFSSSNPSANSNVWDYYHFRVKMENGKIYNFGGDLKYRINKKIIEIDFDTIQVDNGIFIVNGLDETLKRKEYDGKTTTTKEFIEAIYNAVNSMSLEGDRTQAINKLQVTGEYASIEVGIWDINLDIYDPLSIYAISNIHDLKGEITHAGVNIIVENARREYGMREPNYKISITSGLVVGDDIPTLAGIGSITTINSTVGVYDIIVPSPGTQLISPDGKARYKVRSINTNAKLTIVPQVLNHIKYDESFLNISYDGNGHEIKAEYLSPEGKTVRLDVQYSTITVEGGIDVYTPMADGMLPTNISRYRATLLISDTQNYILASSKAVLDFEVHRGNVVVDLDTSYLNKVFNGSAHEVDATLSNGVAPQITYFVDGGRALVESKPIDAGKYTVKVEYDNASDVGNEGNYYSIVEYYELNIAKAKFDSSTGGIKFVGANERTYDGNVSTLLIDNVPDGTIMKNVGGSLDEISTGKYKLFEEVNAGNYTMTLTLTNHNYETIILRPSLKINLARFANVGMILDGETNVTYDGADHTLKLLGIPADTQILPMRDNHANEESATLTAKTSGNHNFYLTLRNVNFVEEKIQTQLKIANAKFNGVQINHVDKVYDGQPSSAVIRGVAEPTITMLVVIRTGSTNLVIQANAKGEYILPERTNAGEQLDRFYLDNPNYVRETLVAKSTIRQAQYTSLSIRFDDVTETYSGGVFRMILSGAPADTRFFNQSTGQEATNVYQATNVGTYVVRLKLSNSNYSDLNSLFSATLKIERAENKFEYSYDNEVVDYNGSEQSIVFDTSQLADGFTATTNNNSYINAGDYKFTVTISSPNYLDRELSSVLTINKIASPDASKFTADNIVMEFINASKPVELILKTDGVTNLSDYNIRITYSGDGLLLGKPVFPSTNPYGATVTITHANYEDVVLERTITIELKKMTGVELITGVFTYNELQHKATVKRNDPIYDSAFVKITYNGVTTAPSNAGVYIVVVEMSMLYYETLTLVDTLIIDKAEFKSGITMDGVTKVYDGKETQLTFVGVPNGCLVTYNIANSFTNVGAYNLVATLTSLNYLDKEYAATVTITPKVVEVTYVGEESYKAVGLPGIKAKFIDVDGKEVEVDVEFAADFNGKTAGSYVAKPKFPNGNYSATEATVGYEFTLTANVNVGAIAGGAAGGAVALGGIIVLIVILKKKVIKM